MQFGRVWWPADAATLASGAPLATDRSAAFHPVELLSQADDGSYSVRYGDGRTASAPPECVLPYDNPVEFGAEEIPIQVPHRRLCCASFANPPPSARSEQRLLVGSCRPAAC